MMWSDIERPPFNQPTVSGVRQIPASIRISLAKIVLFSIPTFCAHK